MQGRWQVEMQEQGQPHRVDSCIAGAAAYCSCSRGSRTRIRGASICHAVDHACDVVHARARPSRWYASCREVRIATWATCRGGGMHDLSLAVECVRFASAQAAFACDDPTWPKPRIPTLVCCPDLCNHAAACRLHATRKPQAIRS